VRLVKSIAHKTVHRSPEWHTLGRMPSTTGLRARVRAELTQEIKDEARRQMEAEGASSLSLRAIARELGMVSSGIYRYFKSRDELLTALIIDAYEELATAVEAADSRCERGDFAGRWRACCYAVRTWALAHRAEYALIYGSPVPGYRAPEETVAPASRVPLSLAAIVHDAAAAGELHSPFVPGMSPKLAQGAAAEAVRLEGIGLGGVPEDAIIRSLVAWTQLFGLVNFEVFGRLGDVVEDALALFDQSVRDVCAFVGIKAHEP
jgi:AcrR family transcriptional regulator